MSPPADPPDLDPDDGHELAAAEYALGVLDDHERQAAARRAALDPAFATEVETWESRFAALAEQTPDQAPPPRLWSAIERQLGNRGVVVEFRLRRALAIWRGATAAAASVAAALAIALVWPQPAAKPIVTARLTGPQGVTVFVAMLDPDRRQIVLTPAAITAAPDRSPELWLIPAGGKPISLGVGAFQQSVRLRLAPRLAAAGGVTLAVSIEPKGGSPTGQATGPVVASGKLEKL